MSLSQRLYSRSGTITRVRKQVKIFTHSGPPFVFCFFLSFFFFLFKSDTFLSSFVGLFYFRPASRFELPTEAYQGTYKVVRCGVLDYYMSK